jgi:(1->4)-alpha-D-glucan 1-alpha-D-glucosylmutase
MENLTPTSLPTATYRLQFHREFTFRQAGDILDYLTALGISHIYASPYFQASESSTHGYDVSDHNRISPEIGSEEDYAAYIAGLRAHGMGQVLDFVPNHMGINAPLNRWWMDVLENGPSSLYADHFDIEWRPLKEELENKVLLPILGDRYGRVLEKGEFKLSCKDGAFSLHYYETRLPLNPRRYPLILEPLAQRLVEFEAEDFHRELLSISTAFAQLPRRFHAGPDAVKLRAREKEVGKQRLARLLDAEPRAAQALDEILRTLEGRPGDPRSFDTLHVLLEAQVYRLSYWRVAAEEINYRRFFDINSLAAIRPEVPAVFEAAHQLAFQMIERGEVTGLRIDHIDGLWNPRAYLEQLQERFRSADGSGSERPLYLVVEKILAADEWLPADWPVHGTTGYEFAADLAQLLLDSGAERSISDTYARFGERLNYGDLAYEKKLLIMRLALASEVGVLGHMLNRLSEKDRDYRDFTLHQLTAAVRETIACLPVYRTYVAPDRPVREEDRVLILKAVRKARRLNPSIDQPIFDFLARVLLLDLSENMDAGAREEYVRFALKFQQCSGPVMAKGLEDTAFYIYNRLVALNEVGGDPGRFGMSVADFHVRCAERLRRCPHTMLATSTHDTKRSEDVRARLVAISELAEEWRRGLAKWRVTNSKWKNAIEGQMAPSPNEEYLLYQTLAGAWPLDGLGDAEARAQFIQRIQDYMIKALKEAKTHSSWVEPDQDWENATRSFVAAILDPARGRSFLRSFTPFAERLAELGAINSLTQTVLKCTTPGVPDFYQGCEIWDFSLVDPDNRRPVDYTRRRELLASLENANPGELMADWRSGRVKLFVTQRLLALRRERPQLFQNGSHEPLAVSGQHAARVVAFRREDAEQAVMVVVPRLTAPLGFPPIGEVWSDTALAASPGKWRDAFTGTRFELNSSALVSEILAHFPIAYLIRESAR